MSSRHVAAALVVAGLAACGGGDGSEGAGTDVAATTVAVVSPTDPGDEPTDATATTSKRPPSTFEASPTRPTADPGATTSSTGPVGAGASANLTAAVADLSARLGVDPAEVRLVSEQDVTWRSSAIGCPEPGVGYLDRLVDGVRIVLEVAGKEYSYHAGGSRSIFYCAHPQLPGD